MITWVEAILGTPIRATIQGGSMRTLAFIDSWEEWENRETHRDDGWFGLLKRLTVADGLLGKGLRIGYANLVISTAGACVFDFNYGGIYLLRGMFGLQALG